MIFYGCVGSEFELFLYFRFWTVCLNGWRVSTIRWNKTYNSKNNCELISEDRISYTGFANHYSTTRCWKSYVLSFFFFSFFLWLLFDLFLPSFSFAPFSSYFILLSQLFSLKNNHNTAPLPIGWSFSSYSFKRNWKRRALDLKGCDV